MTCGPWIGSFSAAWIAASHVGAAGRQRSHTSPPPHAEGRRIFWGGTFERWHIRLCTRTERFNALSTFEFFKALLERVYEAGRKAMVILDNARYHHARLHREWRDDHVDRITFEYLPPYSPDLNPSERVWKLTRRMCLHNRYMPRLEDVIDAVEEQFLAWKDPNTELRRLCAIY